MVSNLGEVSQPVAGPLPVELASIVVGYATDAEFNAQIAKTGLLALSKLPLEWTAALAGIGEITLPNWQQVHVTPEQLQKLQKVYPKITAETVKFEGEVSFEGEEVDLDADDTGMFDDNPPMSVTLRSGKVHAIMAIALTDTLSGWAVETVDWARGRDALQAEPIRFELSDIRSVRRLAPDFETWAALQLGRVHITDK